MTQKENQPKGTPGEIIKRVREERGWNQTQLAARCGPGCSQSRISLWENGLEPMKLYRPFIAAALELDLADLGWEEDAWERTPSDNPVRY